jgi:multidrug efflux system outer membrane protein
MIWRRSPPLRQFAGSVGLTGLASAAVLLLSACSSAPVNPVYQAPATDLPAAWHAELAAAPAFQPAQPADALHKGAWWEAFDDAVLNQLAAQVLAQNQSLQVAAARLQQARAQANVAEAALFPQLGLQAGVARQKISADRPLAAYNTVNQSTVQNNNQLGFAVSYETDLFGRVRNSVQSARASAQQAEADFENMRLVLMAEFAADYFNLRELDREMQIVHEAIVLQEKALQLISDRHALGIASGLDLAQQQALLDSNRTQLELLRKQRSQFEHALATMTGNAAPQFSLPPQVAHETIVALPAGVPADLLQRRPDIAAAERAVAAANASIGVAQAAYYPSLIWQANGGWNSNQWGNLLNAPSILWSLGASLAQTVFDGGKTDANVKFANAAYQASVATYRQSVLVAMQEVEDGMQGGVILARAAQQAEASVRSSERVLTLANDRYLGGVATYLDVISAQQSLLNNQRLWVQIRGQQMLNSVFLIKALGGGWQRPADK